MRYNVGVMRNFDKDRAVDRMKQWIEKNGGTFSSVVNAKVTHLIRSGVGFGKNVKKGAFAALGLTGSFSMRKLCSRRSTPTSDAQDCLLWLAWGLASQEICSERASISYGS